MSFPAYPSYQDSGIAWLGEVPADWRVQKFRFTFRESDEKIESEVFGPMLSVSGYRGIEVKEYDDENQRRAEEDLIGYRIVRPGQLVVNTMWLNYAGLGVSAHEGHVSPAYRAYWFTDRSADPRFIHYLLRSSIYVQGYTQLLTGIRPNSLQMSRADLMDFPVLLPPIPVQTAVAAFLDRETAKIDALIEEQRRLIALLKEKRQAVISHAVTKGLDPHAPMKDSGIEWLGEVPAHWEVAPLKRVLQTATSGPRGWSDLLGSEGGIFFQSQNIGTDMNVILDGAARIAPPAGPDADRASLRIGDVVVCITGGRTGAVAFVDHLPDDAFINQHVCLVRPHPGYASGHFISFALFCEVGQKQLAVAMYGLKQGLSLGDIRDLIVPIPPLIEQEQIAASLASRFGEYDALMAEAMKAVVLLSERRATLISAAVTGKIDVRGSAKVLPFPIERTRARALVGIEIIERSAGQPTFGRVKFQKMAFLAEGHVGIGELAGCYTRAAAGPLDGSLIDDMERGAHSIAGITAEQAGGTGTTVSYRLGQERGAHRQELADWLGPDRSAKLDKMIADFAPLNTKQAEAVATLYGVWNDLLSEGGTPSDDEIIAGFLNDWHPEKRAKFRPSELPEWLGWMRRHGIVPTGSGPKTTTGRLFV
jgi:type I restriction enzyme S subunit